LKHLGGDGKAGLETNRGQRDQFRLLTLAALGVVFGDIGTSPLYALRECFTGPYGLSVSRDNVLGVLALITWALILVVSVKYIGYAMRADNRGEGGILALTALILRRTPRPSRLLVGLGLFGAALLYGDGVITPAISVLSAVEGLELVAPGLEPYVIPCTLSILMLFFAFQRRGTGGVGAVFGPVILVWFTVIAGLGIRAIAARPDVLLGLSPYYAVNLLLTHRVLGFFILGSVFLVVTGAEALYADMGHFGAKPIRAAWFYVAFPALLLNYFGQGALLLQSPEAARSPFYLLAPSWLLFPLILLAMAATVVASQAVVSGAFSLTTQAVQLGYLPRMRIRHTSRREFGQVYVPSVNWTLMIASFGLVLGFRSSSGLAAAYGIAVSTTMVITTILARRVAIEVWGWRRGLVNAITVALLTIDLAFLGANASKAMSGGWVPLLIAAAVMLVFVTWKAGRAKLAGAVSLRTVPLREFFATESLQDIIRIPGTAVFMVSDTVGTPVVLLHHLKNARTLHERVVFLTIITVDAPTVSAATRATVETVAPGFYRVVARYGFAEKPNVPALLRGLGADGLEIDPDKTTFFLGRETLVVDGRSRLRKWQGWLFALLSRNSLGATAYFDIPTNRVVELGVQIQI